MGHHFDAEGRFQSDKYPDLPPDRVAINITDPRTHQGLALIAHALHDDDPEFAEDLLQRLNTLGAHT